MSEYKQQYEVRVNYSVRVVSLFPPSQSEEVFMRGIESEYSLLAHRNASGLEDYFTKKVNERANQ